MATRLPEEDDALRARKKATRAEVRAALRAMSEEEMASQSAAIGRAVVETLAAFRAPAASATAARPVRLGLYVHCAKLREVDTTPLLDAALALRHAEVYVPIVDPPGAGDDAAPSMRFLRVRSLARDLEPKTMGILEPKEFLDDGVTPRENLEDAGFDPPLDVLLMPGLAFETSGARLGRGGGFYDAFLERYRRGCRRAGANLPPTPPSPSRRRSSPPAPSPPRRTTNPWTRSPRRTGSWRARTRGGGSWREGDAGRGARVQE